MVAKVFQRFIVGDSSWFSLLV